MTSRSARNASRAIADLARWKRVDLEDSHSEDESQGATSPTLSFDLEEPSAPAARQLPPGPWTMHTPYAWPRGTISPRDDYSHRGDLDAPSYCARRRVTAAGLLPIPAPAQPALATPTQTFDPIIPPSRRPSPPAAVVVGAPRRRRWQIAPGCRRTASDGAVCAKGPRPPAPDRGEDSDGWPPRGILDAGCPAPPATEAPACPPSKSGERDSWGWADGDDWGRIAPSAWSRRPRQGGPRGGRPAGAVKE